tara:strand:+ start:8221 stop:8550 length:330 start_codon:yes stop_codon:yes gene_type:complete
MSFQTQIAPALSQPPRLRFIAAMPAEDSSQDASDAWREETGEDAIATAYFRHTSDDHGGFYADLIGVGVLTSTSALLYSHDGAVAWFGWETVNRIENVQTQAIADGVAT